MPLGRLQEFLENSKKFLQLGNLAGCILIHFSGLRKSEHGNFRIGISDFLRRFGIHVDDFLPVISP